MSAISDKYLLLGGASSFLGLPVENEKTAADGAGRLQKFQHGIIFWSADTGAHEVHGDILAKYKALGAEGSPLGYPKADETITHDGVGRYNAFTGGVIFWHPSTGAREVRGAILGKWLSLGAERSVLGYPVTDESAAAGGRFNHFQFGSIYWSGATGAHEVHGAIRALWQSLGSETSSLGFPVTDETPLADNSGRFNRFQKNNKSIVWTLAGGAKVV